MSDPEELHLYRQLDDLHGRIAAAAFALDVTEMTALQGEADRLAATLAARAWPPGGAAERRQKAELIRAILAKQAGIRQEIAEWQEETRRLLIELGAPDPRLPAAPGD